MTTQLGRDADVDDRLPVDQNDLARTATLSTADGLHSFAAASPDLACITDLQGVITSTNQAWRSVLGWTRHELVGYPFLDLVHEDDLDRARAAFDEARAGRTVHDLTTRWTTADHEWRWLSWSMTLGPGPHVYASGRDLTDRVQQQLETARRAVELRAELDDERATVAELRERERRKDTYLSAVSHELRTPVTLIQGAVDTLGSDWHQLPADEVAELETLVVDQTQRLSRVIAELLDVDRLSRGQLTAVLDPVELVALVQEVIDASPASDRVSLVAPDEVHLQADAGQLQHVVRNLLENADKYAPEGAVCVTIDADRRCVRIGVRDQGPGIPTTSLERVFEPFWRGDSAGASAGSGMGLALVAEFARLHGGRAWAEPVSRGAHLIVELPVEVPA
ncbi:PAS domain-containing sensor histidine kinase [Nitriliruptor alkaliphilus]|uniref:PAS domain-containing sensor histidine kinase n=1 Tax=Nitriliruptor alkaliphilus TaxID=427918 RepID=UPI001B8053A7|nr:ATP-binding protein [Nitriliruptor alkaliphilus]